MPIFRARGNVSGGSVTYGGGVGPSSPIFWFHTGKMLLTFIVKRTPAALIATGAANAVYYWFEGNATSYGQTDVDEFAAGNLLASASVSMPEMWRRDP